MIGRALAKRKKQNFKKNTKMTKFCSKPREMIAKGLTNTPLKLRLF